MAGSVSGVDKEYEGIENDFSSKEWKMLESIPTYDKLKDSNES